MILLILEHPFPTLLKSRINAELSPSFGKCPIKTEFRFWQQTNIVSVQIPILNVNWVFQWEYWQAEEHVVTHVQVHSPFPLTKAVSWVRKIYM